MFTASGFIMQFAVNWTIVNGKYEVKFSTEEAVGEFKDLTGQIKFDQNNLGESSMVMIIDVNSIQTGDETKNAHAKQTEWLDAATYPTINFVSTGFTKTSNGFETTGKLTMKNVTKEIKIPFTFTSKKKTGIFKGGFSVNRNDYNIEADGIGETIKIDFKIPVKQ